MTTSTLRPQRTLAQSATVSGFGFWSGKDVRVEFRPAAPHTGIVFVRGDLGAIRIPALVSQRIETPRRTTLVHQGAAVEMVEHLLAACSALQVDNCEVWIDQPELPGFDGSSQAFVSALQGAGIVAQPGMQRRLRVTEVTRVGDGESWVEARPTSRPGLTIKYRLDYGSGNAVGRQSLELAVSPESFCRELASARTFLLEVEAEWLRSRGLGLRVSTKDVLVFNGDGPIDNELRFEDECVRHKALDLIGDLALAGCDIEGHIIAHRSGHRLNAELVRVLLSESEIVETRRKSA